MQCLQLLLLALSSPAGTAPAAFNQEPYPGTGGGDLTVHIPDSPIIDLNDFKGPAFASTSAASSTAVAKQDATVPDTGATTIGSVASTTAGVATDKRDFIPRAPYPWESDPTYHGEQLWINVFPDGTIQRPGENISVRSGRRDFS